MMAAWVIPQIVPCLYPGSFVIHLSRFDVSRLIAVLPPQRILHLIRGYLNYEYPVELKKAEFTPTIMEHGYW